MASTQPSFDDATREWTLPTEFVDCEIDGAIVQVPVSDLVCAIGGAETDTEWSSWVEFRRPDDPTPIHRSVRLHLKQGVFGEGVAASF